MKIREAINTILAKRANDTAVSMVSSLCVMLGRDKEVEKIHDKIRRNEKITDDEVKLLNSMMHFSEGLIKVCTISALNSFYSGVNSGALQPTIFTDNEGLDCEMSGFNDNRLSDFIKRMFS